ncbi:FAD-dependent oxidoreductase [Reinekea marinisedimentorum]|uniref:NADPH-dependent 2,4-dienoyl-CoA reductase/sulfur reductase-like enzyme n=1 Tax=Reinekea marinisedimentorum TaxID=230495 RepID=A0A4R3I9Q3_9GAMM|nr:FAD-dependent oxidoreductase [Reinekea marinisedimentorum]TCS43000.1 NADPH-dependent 2,4-dienoyl-CoA reductase/sulfur reductase-like enzyme [Reinekea marinisedimentorum]
MSKKIVIVGGVAGGASAAARARRLDEEAQIIIFERDSFISFANCGLPYHIGGEIKERSALLVQTPESMKARFNLDVRIHSEVIAIDTAEKTVTVRNVTDGTEYSESYDDLVLSPGSNPIVPPIPGVDSSSVFTLRNIPDMDKIIQKINIEAPRSAVVVGGGYIGIEMAEALIHRGIETTMVELADQIMPPMDPEMAVPLHQEMRRAGVRLKLKDAVSAIEETGEGLELTMSSGTVIKTDMLVMAIGVKPEVSLAKQAGLALGERGGIKVDKHMRTSAPGVWAVGDAIEVTHFVTGSAAHIPLAGPANRQGRIVADNILGIPSEYKDTLGTGVCKVFNLTAASTGASEKQLNAEGISYEKIYVHGADHAGYYPGATQINLKLVFDPKSGLIFGAQAIGPKGVDKRIDVLATAIRARLTVFDLEEFELCYAPPFGSAKDVVNQAGFVASNVIRGEHEICHTADLESGDMVLLDVRNPTELGVLGTIEQAINIPVNNLRDNLERLPKDKTIAIFCAVGLRGYVAYRLLKQLGYKVKNVTGGYTTYQMVKRIGQ